MKFRSGLMAGGALLLLVALTFVVFTESLHHPLDHGDDHHGTAKTVHLDYTGHRGEGKVEKVGIDRPDRHHDHDVVRKSDGISHAVKNGEHGMRRPHGGQNPDQESHVTEVEHSDWHSGGARKTHRLRHSDEDSSQESIQHDERRNTKQNDHSADHDATTKSERLDHSDHLDGKPEIDRIRRARMQSRMRKSSRHGGAMKAQREDQTERQSSKSKENDEHRRPSRHNGAKKAERLEHPERRNGGRKTDRHAGMRKVNRFDNPDQVDGVKSSEYRHGGVRKLHRHGGLRKTDRNGGGNRVVYRHIKRTDRDAGIRKIDRRLQRTDPAGDVKQMDRQGRVRNANNQDGGVKKTTVQDGSVRRTHRHGGVKKIHRHAGARKNGSVRKTEQNGTVKKTDEHRGRKSANRQSGARKPGVVRKIDGHGAARRIVSVAGKKTLRHGAVRKSNQLGVATKFGHGYGVKKADGRKGDHGDSKRIENRQGSVRRSDRFGGVRKDDRLHRTWKSHQIHADSWEVDRNNIRNGNARKFESIRENEGKIRKFAHRHRSSVKADRSGGVRNTEMHFGVTESDQLNVLPIRNSNHGAPHVSGNRTVRLDQDENHHVQHHGPRKTHRHNGAKSSTRHAHRALDGARDERRRVSNGLHTFNHNMKDDAKNVTFKVKVFPYAFTVNFTTDSGSASGFLVYDGAQKRQVVYHGINSPYCAKFGTEEVCQIMENSNGTYVNIPSLEQCSITLEKVDSFQPENIPNFGEYLSTVEVPGTGQCKAFAAPSSQGQVYYETVNGSFPCAFEFLEELKMSYHFLPETFNVGNTVENYFDFPDFCFTTNSEEVSKGPVGNESMIHEVLEIIEEIVANPVIF